MNKRVLAWILLIGFLLLLLNILVFRVYQELFIVVYIIIVFAFVFSKGKLFQQEDSKDSCNDCSNDSSNDNSNGSSKDSSNDSSNDSDKNK